jgi:hypothetical protein
MRSPISILQKQRSAQKRNGFKVNTNLIKCKQSSRLNCFYFLKLLKLCGLNVFKNRAVKSFFVLNQEKRLALSLYYQFVEKNVRRKRLMSLAQVKSPLSR